MASKQILDELAKLIRSEIEKSEIHFLHETDLARLWGPNHDLSPVEKTLLIHNFANSYGFKVRVNDKQTSAVFHALNKRL